MFFKKHWFNIIGMCYSLPAAIISIIFSKHVAAIFFLLCMIIFVIGIRLDIAREKERQQEELIAVLKREVEALDIYVRALVERQDLDYEHLKQRDETIYEAVRKIETEIKCYIDNRGGLK